MSDGRVLWAVRLSWPRDISHRLLGVDAWTGIFDFQLLCGHRCRYWSVQKPGCFALSISLVDIWPNACLWFKAGKGGRLQMEVKTQKKKGGVEFAVDNFLLIVNRWPSQQSSKEEYKPWKWVATTKYYVSHTKTMLPTGKSTPRSSRQSDHCKEAQTAVLRSCLPFIRSGQNRLTRHNEKGKKTRQTEEEVGRQHQVIDSSSSPRGQ